MKELGRKHEQEEWKPSWVQVSEKAQGGSSHHKRDEGGEKTERPENKLQGKAHHSSKNETELENEKRKFCKRQTKKKARTAYSKKSVGSIL